MLDLRTLPRPLVTLAALAALLGLLATGAPTAASAADAAEPADAGQPADAAKPADAGRPADAGQPADAGKPADAGQPADAGAPADAEKPADAAPAPAARVATPTIVPFEAWAPAECPRPTGEDAAATVRTVVHHTHEPVANTPEEVVPALVTTCAAHVGRGFSTIGYHYVVDPWGGIYQGRGGLPEKDGTAPAVQGQGAHVAGSNGGAVGVVFLGDHADAPPTEAALAAATHLLAWLLEGAGTAPDAAVPSISTGEGTARFVGAFTPLALSSHTDSNHTECPGEHLIALLPDLRTRVSQTMAGEAPASWAGLGLDGGAPAPSAPTSAVVAAPDPTAADPAAAAPPAGTTAVTPPPATTVDDRAVQTEPSASAGERIVRGLARLGLPALALRFDTSSPAG